jgi:GWxTD domain-containing protein
MTRDAFLLFPLCVTLTLSSGLALQERTRDDVDALRREQEEDHYRKWLDEDVVYIISPEEKAVFRGLTTPEEKEQFIEQFWFRRDPDPRTAVNEYREEHYRRIAYANEQFASGLPGWKTDRGRVYITHGPPDQIEARPSGGRYSRPMHEGGGTTATYPFEVWWYRHIPGIGDDVELEFVDPSFSDEYRLALRPEEKDALLHVPGAGLTLAEELGLAQRDQHPYFSPGMRDYPYMFQRAKDSPFARYETYSMVQRPPEIKYPDLKEIVGVNITFDDLSFRLRQDYFDLNENQVLVPITVEVPNRNLTFREEGGVHRAKLAVYGMITNISNRVIGEFEDDLVVSYTPQSLESGLQRRSMYQKIVPLDRNMRYRLDVVVKDLTSGRVGVTRVGIAPPAHRQETLTASSLLLSNSIRQLEDIPQAEEMFVIGDVKVLPSISNEFYVDHALGVYFQVYNVGINQTTMTPDLSVVYEVVDGAGEKILEFADERGQSIQFFSPQRLVLVWAFSTADLQPGSYRITARVHDRIKGATVEVADDFELTVPPTRMAATR